MTTPTLKDIAISAELIVNGYDEGFDYKEAQLLAIEVLKEGSASLVDIYTVATEGDIYELLEGSQVADVLKTHSCVGLITTGWASPLAEGESETSPEVAPSKHPARRRVRLVIVANQEGVESVLRFSDDPTEIVTDDGRATGSLSVALGEAIKRKGK